MNSSVIRSIIDIREGKREFISDEDIGGAGVVGRLKRVGMERIRVEIGSSFSILLEARPVSLIY